MKRPPSSGLHSAAKLRDRAWPNVENHSRFSAQALDPATIMGLRRSHRRQKWRNERQLLPIAMAIVLPTLRFPDPRLHRIARPVRAVDERIRALADDILATMYQPHRIAPPTTH